MDRNSWELIATLMHGDQPIRQKCRESGEVILYTHNEEKGVLTNLTAALMTRQESTPAFLSHLIELLSWTINFIKSLITLFKIYYFLTNCKIINYLNCTNYGGIKSLFQNVCVECGVHKLKLNAIY